MKIVVFLNSLGLGGGEKAAWLWSRALKNRGHEVLILSLTDGPRRGSFENDALPVIITGFDVSSITTALKKFSPQVIHAHAPGFPHEGDLLGPALKYMPSIPVVQTNIFGRLDNPRENEWTTHRLFVSYTSALQACLAINNGTINPSFFKRCSVAINPIVASPQLSPEERSNFRKQWNIPDSAIVFGRVARKDPHKWSTLSLASFRLASKKIPQAIFLMREPPASVTVSLLHSPDSSRYRILPETSDPEEVRLTQGSLDVILHATLFGESFGYTLAEGMDQCVPTITNSTPWGDQAQLELVQQNITGWIASTPATMAKAIELAASDPIARKQMGLTARSHIHELANETKSVDRLEQTLFCAINGQDNPFEVTDYEQIFSLKKKLDETQWGNDDEMKVLKKMDADIRSGKGSLPSWMMIPAQTQPQ